MKEKAKDLVVVVFGVIIWTLETPWILLCEDSAYYWFRYRIVDQINPLSFRIYYFSHFLPVSGAYYLEGCYQSQLVICYYVENFRLFALHCHSMDDNTVCWNDLEFEVHGCHFWSRFCAADGGDDVQHQKKIDVFEFAWQSHPHGFLDLVSQSFQNFLLTSFPACSCCFRSNLELPLLWDHFQATLAGRNHWSLHRTPRWNYFQFPWNRICKKFCYILDQN